MSTVIVNTPLESIQNMPDNLQFVVLQFVKHIPYTGYLGLYPASIVPTVIAPELDKLTYPDIVTIPTLLYTVIELVYELEILPIEIDGVGTDVTVLAVAALATVVVPSIISSKSLIKIKNLVEFKLHQKYYWIFSS